MKRLVIAAAVLALSACDQIPFLQGDEVEVVNGSTSNTSTGNSTATADAGITSSRSLTALGTNGGGQEGQGGKDPSAVQAGSTGTVDPRLVGRWTDTNDCKVAVELRPDGNFVTNEGGGRWEVAGDTLTFSSGDRVFRLRLDSVEPDRILTTNQNGERGQSTRC